MRGPIVNFYIYLGSLTLNYVGYWKDAKNDEAYCNIFSFIVHFSFRKSLLNAPTYFLIEGSVKALIIMKN